MTGQTSQNGFTVIEVLLFLAISGVLLAGALLGVNASINNSRFNDAANSTVSFMQRVYAEVQGGRNSRNNALGCVGGVVNTTGTTAGMTNCVILGRLIQFDVGGSMTESRYIIGRDNSTQPSDDTAAVLAAAPAPVSRSNGPFEEFSVPWSVELDTMRRGGTDVNYLAIVRSPASERILIYSFQGADNLTSLNSSHISNSTLNQAVNICLRDTSNMFARIGYIRIGAGQGQDVIKADLSTTSGACS